MKKTRTVFATLAVLALFGCAHSGLQCDPDRDAARAMSSHAVFVRKVAIGLSAEGEIVSNSWSDSGVVVANSGDDVLVYTAGHVCREEREVSYVGSDNKDHGAVALTNVMKTFDLQGNAMGEEAEIVAIDDDLDLCLLSAVGHVAPARMAEEAPLPGSRIQIAGFPQGIFVAGGTNVTEGRVMGEKSGRVVTSAPASQGSSGSGVYYQGRLVGLLVAGMLDYEHITLITPFKQTSEFLAAGRVTWEKGLGKKGG